MQTYVAPHIPHQLSPFISFSSRVINSVNFDDMVNIDFIEEISRKGSSDESECQRAVQTIKRLI